MRMPKPSNWILLCLNVVLSLFLALALLSALRGRGVNITAHPLPDNQRALGMEFYYEKGPFVLLVGEDFPRNRSFMLSQRDRPLSIVAFDDRMGEPGVNSASLQLAPDFSLSCDYSFAGDSAHVHQLRLSYRKEGLNESLFDLNVDGVFDLRQTRDEERFLGHVKVWYQSAWWDVMGADKDPEQDQFHKQLLDGTRVSFVAERGQWLSETEKPATGHGDIVPAKKPEP